MYTSRLSISKDGIKALIFHPTAHQNFEFIIVLGV